MQTPFEIIVFDKADGSAWSNDLYELVRLDITGQIFVIGCWEIASTANYPIPPSASYQFLKIKPAKDHP